MEYNEEHRSWSICREQRLFAVFEKYSVLSKHPSPKKCSSSDLCIFCLLSSTKSVPMYLVTCRKYKQTHFFISPCRNNPFQLQNCRTKRFFMVFWNFACELATAWRNSFSRTPQNRACFYTPKQSMFFRLFLSVRKFHSVWDMRHCTASTVVPKYGPYLVQMFRFDHDQLLQLLYLIFGHAFRFRAFTSPPSTKALRPLDPVCEFTINFFRQI